MPFHTILVPLDGSELAERALPTAVAVACESHCRLLLLRAFHDYDEGADVYLHGLQVAHANPNLVIETRAVHDDAASAVVDTAVVEQADLIVMSSHGRSGWRRLVLGSVTERVLQSAACPVLVVRRQLPILRSVILLDGSELAERAVEPGLTLARCLHCRVTLLRISATGITPPRESVEIDWVEEDSGRMLQESSAHSAEEYLSKVAGRCQVPGIDLDTQLIEGQVVPSILNFVENKRVGLVMMTTHGRTGLSRWLFGSVTARLMHETESSMLIVRPPKLRAGLRVTQKEQTNG